MTIIGYTHVAMEIWGCIFSLIIILSMKMMQTRNHIRKRLFLKMLSCNALLLFSDALAWSFRGKPGEVASLIVHVSNMTVFILGYVMLVMYTNYLITYIGQETKAKRYWKYMILFIAFIGIALIVCTQFNHMIYRIDEHNFYHRNSWFFLSQVTGLLGAGINTVVIYKNRKIFQKREFYATISYLILPFLSMVVQLFIYGISLLNISITISLLWMYFVRLIEREEEVLWQAKEVNDMQTKIVMSQIQPHFLYNTLNTIYYLCEQDSEQAQRAVSEFSEFLRGNLDSLKISNPIPFETELKHLKIYLQLEKMRFDDRLQIEYDIETVNFKIPALSVQPLAENAVKYGIGKKEEGGTVKILTREYDTEYRIQVEDDGVGFDVMEPKEDGRTHIGLENVKTRLETMCHGALFIESTRNKGTIATIIIPK